MNIFITGVSRGIGLGLTKQALVQGHRVLAVARSPEESSELGELLHQYSDKLVILKMDLQDKDAASKIQNFISHVDHIDLLVNNAGVFEKADTREAFMSSFEINSYLPFLVTRALLSKLQQSSRPKVIHLSSIMGSISDNNSGDYYAYRASKSALNMINKSLSIDHPWLTTIVVHPGWVQTRMGGIGALITVDESTSGLWRLIEKIDNNDTGRFFDYLGNMLPW